MTTMLRPLSTGELLDRAFSLYRSHFVLFVGIAAIPQLVLLAFQVAGSALSLPDNTSDLRLGVAALGLIELVFDQVVTAAVQAATIVAVAQVHLNRPATVWDSFARIKHLILRVIGLGIVVGLGTSLGLLLCIVPGILLALRWAIAVPVAVLENFGVGDSMSRSTHLTEGNRGRIFLIGVLFFVLIIATQLLLEWPIPHAISLLTHGAGSKIWSQIAEYIAAFISACLAAPLLTIALSLVYFDERVRKEALDLEIMMETMEPVTESPA